MANGSSDLVRRVATEMYVQPAVRSGKTQFSVAVRDIMKDLQLKGFPAGNYPQICTAIRTGKFLKENGLEIEGIDGPPSGLSTTVVVRYRVVNPGLLPDSSTSAPPTPDNGQLQSETPAQRVVRLMGGLRGLLHEEYKEYGGGEGFLRWLRSEDDEEPRSDPIQ